MVDTMAPPVIDGDGDVEMPDYTDIGITMDEDVNDLFSHQQRTNGQFKPHICHALVLTRTLFFDKFIEAAALNTDAADSDETSSDHSGYVEEDEDHIRLIDTKYKTSGVIDDGSDDLACVYDCRSIENIGPNSYCTSELISIELYDLIKEFSIPRDAYRKIVRLMNTTIRDNDKLARGKIKERRRN
jgi:hypothetical protein